MALQMHTSNKMKRKTKKQKSCYSISGLTTVIHPPNNSNLLLTNNGNPTTQAKLFSTTKET
jgi:hypothetical protein